MDHNLITFWVVVAGLGIAAQWLAWRFKIPAIILLIACGIAVGPVFGIIDPSRDLGHGLEVFIALGTAVILFEGGFNLRWHEYRETGVDVNRLITVGLLLTWLLGTVAAHYVAGLSWEVALMFGAIIVVTGPTVIIPLLKEARLTRRPRALLKWEGIINDPIGVLLAVLLFEYLTTAGPESDVPSIIVSLGMALGVAGISGVAAGWFLGRCFERGYVPEFLKSPVVLAVIFALYAAVNQVQDEAGLLAVTVLGITLGNQRVRNIDELRRFKEYITVLLVSVIFILLTADIDAAVWQRLDWRSIVLLAVVVFVIRPVAVYLATLDTGIDRNQRLLIAWIAPRGIVAAAIAGLFASRLEQSGYPDAAQLLPLVFAVIVVTVVLHGSTIGWLGRRLGLAAGKRNGVLIVGASPWSVDLCRRMQEFNVPVILSDTSWDHLQPALHSGLRVHHGQILSERAEETVELNEISHVLAMTANPAYNALVCTYFAPDMGENNVFQLASAAEKSEERKRLSRTIRGRIAFDGKTGYEDFMHCFYHGWRFHATPLTDEFSYEQYAERYGNHIPIALIMKSAAITFYPLPEAVTPKSGDTVISFGPGGAADAGERPP